MSRVTVLLLALAGAAATARGQTPGSGGLAQARDRLARADSLWTQLARRDSLERQRSYGARLARRVQAGPLAVLLPSSVGTATEQRVAAGARAFIDGAIPAAFAGAHVVVARAAAGADSVLRTEGLASRAVIVVDVAARPDTFANGWTVAGALASAYRESLDTTWRAWLPLVLPLGWTMARDGPGAVRELMGAGTRTGADCLGGSVRGCRLWLGLDADTNPYRSRYTPAELRREIGARWFGWGDALALARQCNEGSDEACVRAAARGLLAAVPAGPSSIGSLLAFVRAKGPPGALPRAFADSAGSVGDRLARAAGVPEDSLLGAWRIWLMTGGGLPPVTATLRDTLPVVVFAGLLLLAAARSGRWR